MSTPEVNPWTPERVTELVKLAAQGLSATRITVLLGLQTRNQVIGKLHRLGIELGAQTRRETIRQTARLRAAPKPAAKPKVEAPREPEPATAKVVPIRPKEAAQFAGPSKLLSDLGACECRWPLNDPGPGRMEETRFCAAPGAPPLGEPLPYCEHHQRRAVSSDTRKQSPKEFARSLRRYV